ncbi:hypothetical protein [Streptomyces niveus]
MARPLAPLRVGEQSWCCPGNLTEALTLFRTWATTVAFPER